MQARPSRTQTPFAHISRLKPGTRVTIREGTTETRTHWSIESEQTKPRALPIEKAKSELRTALTRAVRARFAGKPIAVALSGGLDSTIAAALAHECGAQITAFTIGYQHLHAEDDMKYAKLVADHYGWPHIAVWGDDLPLYEPRLWDLDLMRSSHMNPSYEMAIQMAQCSPLGLNGLSGDNILGCRAPRLNQWLPWLTESIRRKERLPIQWRKAPTLPPYSVPPYLRAEVIEKFHLENKWHALKLRQRDYPHPTHPYLAHSLEFYDWTERYRERIDYQVLDPFFDLNVVRFSLSIPPFPLLYRKKLQRELAKDLLPAEVANRPKTPLGDVFTSLLRVSDPAVYDEWEPHSKLSDWVIRDHVPKVTGKHVDPINHVHHLRPFYLNEWFKGLDSYLEAHRNPLFNPSDH